MGRGRLQGSPRVSPAERSGEGSGVIPVLAALCAAGLALVHFFCNRLVRVQPLSEEAWFSAAGGVSVAYVFLHLLPELERHQAALEHVSWLGALEHHAYLLALAGLALFYGLERAVRRSKRDADGEDGERDAGEGRDFWLHIGAFALYNALIGYLLLEQEDVRELLLFSVAIALHFVVNDNALRNHHEEPYDRIGRWVMAGAVMAGFGLGLGFRVSEAVLAVFFAVLAGGIVLNVLKEELPEERKSRFLAFAGGAGLYALLLLAL